MKTIPQKTILVSALLAAPMLLSAQTITSLNSGKWETGGNWVGGNSPGVDTIPARADVEHDMTVDSTTGTVDLGNPSGTFMLVIGTSFNAGSVSVSGGTLQGDKRVRIANNATGDLIMTGGTLSVTSLLEIGNTTRTEQGIFDISDGSATFTAGLTFNNGNGRFNYSGGTVELGGIDLASSGNSSSIFSLSEIGGSGYNGITVNGDIDADLLTLDLSMAGSVLSGLSAGDRFTLFDYSGAVNSNFSSDGTIAGEISDGDTLSIDGTDFTYDTDTDLGGGDLAVTITAIPEPGASSAILGLAIGSMLLLTRRRRG
jgi:hypothetical protein